ncbi:F-box/LRR-repeat protein 17, partial [Frankliniella fusca]
ARPGSALLQLPGQVLLRVFAHLGARERALPVCRRWVDLGLRAELWRAVDFGPRGSRDALCRRLEFAPDLERLSIADRRDVNHILDVVLRRCPRLAHLSLKRCHGPGAVLHCGTFSPRSVTVLDTPVSNQLVDLLANITSRMHECTVSVNVEQAAALFGSLLKMALVADGKVPEQLKTLDITFGSLGDDQGHGGHGEPGTLRWRRKGFRGTMSYNRVRLSCSFSSKVIQ